MKSILLLCAVAGAVSDASKCQADENTLLQVQGRNTMRKTKTVGSKDSKAILEKMRDVANSLVEGSDTTMSEDDVTDALDAVIGPLTELSAAILQQVANAQQQITDASSGFQSCSTSEEASLRASMEQRAAAVESCQNTLDQLRTAETQQCRTAEDCLCDEARVRTTDQEALCGALTESYEVTFCEHHNMCANSQQCHSLQAEVYQRLTADVQAEMALVVEEYIAVEQSLCMNRLSSGAMAPSPSRRRSTSRRRSISRAALDACDDVDVSAIAIRYPAATAPPTCPAPTQGAPQCGAHGGSVATLRWDGGSLIIPDGFDGCLTRWDAIDGQRFPNDRLTGITGIRSGCTIHVLTNARGRGDCGHPRGANYLVTEDTMDLRRRVAGPSAVIVSCAAGGR